MFIQRFVSQFLILLLVVMLVSACGSKQTQTGTSMGNQKQEPHYGGILKVVENAEGAQV